MRVNVPDSLLHGRFLDKGATKFQVLTSTYVHNLINMAESIDISVSIDRSFDSMVLRSVSCNSPRPSSMPSGQPSRVHLYVLGFITFGGKILEN